MCQNRDICAKTGTNMCQNRDKCAKTREINMYQNTREKYVPEQA